MQEILSIDMDVQNKSAKDNAASENEQIKETAQRPKNTKIRFVMKLILVIVYTVMGVIPCSLAIIETIPPDEDLMKSTGEILFEAHKSTNTYTILDTPEGQLWLTCRSSVRRNSHDCIMDDEVAKRIQGKRGVALWYSKSLYPTEYSKRLVELQVDGEKVFSRKDAQSDDKGDSIFAIICLPISLMILIFNYKYCLKKIERS